MALALALLFSRGEWYSTTQNKNEYYFNKGEANKQVEAKSASNNLSWLYSYLHISIWIFSTLFIYFVVDTVLQLIFLNGFFKHSIMFEKTYCWFHYVVIFYIKFRFCGTFTGINSVIRILLIETLHRFKTIKYWFTLYLLMYNLG